ncbi:MAG TPA: hypothetical protein VI408_03245 [Gaiellaceae bacterium]
MPDDSLVFALPNGRTAEVAPRPARLICNRLWELGIAAGAATAAARISDALHGPVALRADVAFSEREAPTIVEAAKSHPPTWARLVSPGTLDTISIAERRRLVDTCLEVIDELNADDEHEKLRALVGELERFRDRLRAMTARELLHDAAGRVAAGWSQGADARASDGEPVDVLDPGAASWSLLGALQSAAFAARGARVDEIKLAVTAIAELIADPSLANWNDQPKRTQDEVRSVLARAETLTGEPAETSR